MFCFVVGRTDYYFTTLLLYSVLTVVLRRVQLPMVPDSQPGAPNSLPWTPQGGACELTPWHATVPTANQLLPVQPHPCAAIASQAHHTGTQLEATDSNVR